MVQGAARAARCVITQRIVAFARVQKDKRRLQVKVEIGEGQLLEFVRTGVQALYGAQFTIADLEFFTVRPKGEKVQHGARLVLVQKNTLELAEGPREAVSG